MSEVAVKAFFFGTHKNRLDSKGRVSFPAPFRSVLTKLGSEGAMVYKSPKHKALEGVTVERMMQMAAALETLSPYAAERDDFQMAIFSEAHQLQFDPEGRCVIPRALLDEAGIGQDLAFTGNGQTFQIWEPGALSERKTKSADAVSTGAVRFPILSQGAA